ncbi:hypothetical protein [Virgibacillus proomii]|uniref:hypothetical protein n=1 Tax=Virgibacillus proomii TaxID=84407 RepID=UPI001C112D32|nr:hypothetical protein [Virgibacillus proomii]MBU5267081.1 hypothetical protein [Virgibacillus proomii]
MERDINEKAEELFYIQKSFPMKVFRKRGQILFNDFYLMLDEEVWPQLQYLAKMNGDTNIRIADISQFKKRLWKTKRKCKIFSIPISMNANDYINILDEKGIIVESEKVIWFSSSANWGIWAERSWDISALFSRLITNDFYDWVSLNEDIIELIQDKKVKGKKDENIKILRSNYM